MLDKFWIPTQLLPEHIPSLMKTCNHILPMVTDRQTINTHHYKTIESDLGTIRVSIWTMGEKEQKHKEPGSLSLIDDDNFTVSARMTTSNSNGPNIVLEIIKHS